MNWACLDTTMTPANVPNEVLLNAKLMQLQLLICTHTPEITLLIRNVYDIDLELHSMRSSDGILLIQVDLEDLYTTYTVTTFGCLEPTPDILVHLNKRIEDDIKLLYEAISQYKNKHTICTTSGESQDKYTRYPVPS